MSREQLAIFGGPKAVRSPLRCTTWPEITPEDTAAVMDVMARAARGDKIWGIHTDDILALEARFAQLAGVRHAIYTNSGTSALHMAVAAAGVGPGDEVVVPAVTFIATATAVMHHNALPVFADVDPHTGLVTAQTIERCITRKTKAVIPVHLHGLPADMDDIALLARKKGLVVIEDACQAPGAFYKGRPVGGLGDMAAFSFNGCKQVAAGEGGMFLTDDAQFYERANRVRTFGETIRRDAARTYEVSEMGWMYRSTSLTAALALSQLNRLETTLGVRRGNCAVLETGLHDVPGLIVPKTPSGVGHSYFTFPVLLDAKALGVEGRESAARDRIVQALVAEGVTAGLWQRLPLTGQDFFSERLGYGRGCPWTCRFAARKSPAQDCPQARTYTDSYWILNDIQKPAIALGGAEELMTQFAQAVRKVMTNVQEVLK